MSFKCMDCQICTKTINEYYMLKMEIWLKANPLDDGMLCIKCLEKRLDRKLNSSDFSDCTVNRDHKLFQKSKLLLNRLMNK